MTTRVRTLVWIGIVTGLLLMWWSRPSRVGVPGAGSIAATTSTPSADEDAARARGADSLRDSAAHHNAEHHETSGVGSLAGTEVAGGLLVDASGNFVPGPEAVELFEYFLSTIGEKPVEQILADIRNEIRRRLQAPAVDQALAFLDRYMLYRDRGVALGLSDPGSDDLRARFESLRALRREIFGPELSDRLFGDAEAEAEVAIEQQEVAKDPDLSDEEKKAKIDKLYENLPPAARQAYEQSKAVETLEEDEAKIRASGGGDEDIRTLRVERFGEDGADRLETLDKERAQWNSRFDDYRSARDGILADASLSDAQKQAAIDRLQQQRFNDNERIRVKALDELRDQQQSASR
ncbi:MAG TPA: lipase secretion chaperone [Candidatus Binatia bacterium]